MVSVRLAVARRPAQFVVLGALVLGAWLLHSTVIAQVNWPDRSLIKGSGTRTYIVAGGKACWIPTAEIFNALGLDWNAIRTIPDADMNRIAKSPLLLKASGPEVYLVEGGTRQWIRSAEIFAGMNLDAAAIVTIGDAQLRSIPEGAPIDRVRGLAPAAPQNLSIGGRPVASAPPGPVTVRFHNPGLAVMDIYSVSADGVERRWGGIGPESTTIPIPTRAGELWRFRLSPSARSNNSVRDEYRATTATDQRHDVPGFLNNAEDPSPSVISAAVGELARSVAAMRQQVTRAVNSVGTPRLPTSCGPGVENQLGRCYPPCPAGQTGVGPMCWPQLAAADVQQIINDLRARADAFHAAHRESITASLNHLRLLTANTPNLVPRARAASGRGDRNGAAQLLQLDRLIASLPRGGEPARAPQRGPAWQVRRTPWFGMDTPLSPGPAALGGTGASARQPVRIVTFAPMILDASVVFGGSWEVGMGWQIDGEVTRGADWSYDAWSWAVGVTAGADYSINVGIWYCTPDNFKGESHGITIGGAVGVGYTVTYWFSYSGDALGFTITPAAGASYEIEYVRAKTNGNY